MLFPNCVKYCVLMVFVMIVTDHGGTKFVNKSVKPLSIIELLIRS